MMANRENTLRYDEEKCNGCGLCATVCPHGVFEVDGRKARLVNKDACMECGACRLNCEAGAIGVDSNVGCASAMILAAIRGRSSRAACC